MPPSRVLLHPPVEEDGVALLRRVDPPVKLRGEEVNPALLKPGNNEETKKNEMDIYATVLLKL